MATVVAPRRTGVGGFVRNFLSELVGLRDTQRGVRAYRDTQNTSLIAWVVFIEHWVAPTLAKASSYFPSKEADSETASGRLRQSLALEGALLVLATKFILAVTALSIEYVFTSPFRLTLPIPDGDWWKVFLWLTLAELVITSLISAIVSSARSSRTSG